MKIEKVKLADLKLPERNVRKHPETQIKEFMRSVEMFGQTRPIVVDEDNIILIGNGLYKAMERLGKEEADVLKRTDLSESDKKKLMIADNKIFSLGVDDLDAINDMINEMLDYDVPGFDEDLLKMMMADAEEVTEKIAEYGTLDDEEIADIQQKKKAEASPERTSEPFAHVHQAEERDPGEHNGDSAAMVEQRFVICPKCGEKIWL